MVDPRPPTYHLPHSRGRSFATTKSYWASVRTKIPTVERENKVSRVHKTYGKECSDLG